jgi:hypothetical protein
MNGKPSSAKTVTLGPLYKQYLLLCELELFAIPLLAVAVY